MQWMSVQLQCRTLIKMGVKITIIMRARIRRRRTSPGKIIARVHLLQCISVNVVVLIVVE